MNFHETIYGHRFFEAQLPNLIKAMERIADGLAHLEAGSPQSTTPTSSFLHDLYYGDYEPSVFKKQSSEQKKWTNRFPLPKQSCETSCRNPRQP